jgi:hypothetical protein
MSYKSDLFTRRDNIASELAAVRNNANHAYVLRLWEELRRLDELLQSPLTDATSADDLGPFERETRGVT